MALTLNLSVQRASGALVLNLAPLGDIRTAIIAGQCRVTGSAQLGIIISATIVGFTAGCRGAATLAYDPNLLSDTTAHSASVWQHGALLNYGAGFAIQNADDLSAVVRMVIHAGEGLSGVVDAHWRNAEQLTGIGIIEWGDGEGLNAGADASWLNAERSIHATATLWNTGLSAAATTDSRFKSQLPLLTPDVRLSFADGVLLPQHLESGMSDGLHVDTAWLTAWNDAGLAFNAWLPPYVPPPTPPQTKVIKLNLRRYRQPGPLILNLKRDSDQTDWDVAIQRVYAVYNECYLVRLPDRTPLPVTSMTISTDSNSWCWGLSANLSGAEGWALVEPQSPGFMPIEVEAMINGHVWQFVLDLPNHSRQFNNNKESLSGRSRSAWLDSPYDPLTTGTISVDRTMNQIGEEILGIPLDSRWSSSGFSLIWNVDDWQVPAKVFTWQNMDRMSLLKKVANSIRACVYSDPRLPIITIEPRYKVQSWMLDSSPVEVTIPADALLDWSKQPDRKPYYNGVYVSGTENGVLAWIKIAGTDGMQVADQPIVDSLCCDSEGIAARQRGLVELSESAMGYQIQVKTILTNGGIGGPSLIRPNQLVKFNDIKGFTRSVSINASLSGGWNGVLGVKQTIEMERREHE